MINFQIYFTQKRKESFYVCFYVLFSLVLNFVLNKSRAEINDFITCVLHVYCFKHFISMLVFHLLRKPYKHKCSDAFVSHCLPLLFQFILSHCTVALFFHIIYIQLCVCLCAYVHTCVYACRRCQRPYLVVGCVSFWLFKSIFVLWYYLSNADSTILFFLSICITQLYSSYDCINCKNR